VKIVARARLKARPIQPVFHSQSFRLHISFLGVEADAAFPGTKIKETRKMRIAGPTPAANARLVVEIVSVTTGNDIFRSTRENGRWDGLVKLRPPAIPAIILEYVS